MINLTIVIISHIYSLKISALFTNKQKSSIKISKSGFIFILNNKLTYSTHQDFSTTHFTFIDIHKDTFIKRFNYINDQLLNKGNWILLNETPMSKSHKGYLLREGDIIKIDNIIYKLIESSSLYQKKPTMTTTCDIKSPNNTLYTNTMSNKTTLGLGKLNMSNSNLLRKNESISSLVPVNGCNTYQNNLPKFHHLNKSQILLLPPKKGLSEVHLKKGNYYINNNKNTLYQCRICKKIDDLCNNCLICPCNCEGKFKYIHTYCLKKIFFEKLKIEKKNLSTKYSFDEVVCDYCKSIIPKKMKINNIIFSFVDFIRPESTGQYLIFEKIGNKKEYEFIVIEMKDKKEIKVGYECEFDIDIDNKDKPKVGIISIDEEGDFYLTALHNNVFVFLQGDIMLIPNLPFVIKNNECIMKFEMNLNFCKKLICYKNKTLARLSYYDSFNLQKMILYTKELVNLKSIYVKDYIDECLNIDFDNLNDSSEKENNEIIVLQTEIMHESSKSSGSFFNEQIKQTQNNNTQKRNNYSNSSQNVINYREFQPQHLKHSLFKKN